MTETDHVIYLANATYIAHCDSTLTPKELAALNEIRTTIGAKKGALNSARKVVESNVYALAKCGNFATQVSNLSDMLYLCFVDGELSEKESSVILKFAENIGLTHQQVNMMIEEARERASNLTFKVTCPKCSKETDVNAKFCPGCGTTLTNSSEDDVKTGFAIPSAGHSIEFAESTGAGFPRALELAKSAPKFETCVRSKKTWYLASWPEDDFASLISLADALSGIRNRRYYYNGSEDLWNEVFAFIWCAAQRASAYKPVEYCFGKNDNRINIAGCIHARLEWTEWADWFSYGSFKQNGIFKKTLLWVFDKERIQHEAMAKIHRYRRCPYLRLALLEAVIRALPDEVEVSPNSDWKYNRVYDDGPGCVKVVEIEKSGGSEYKNEYYSNGVRPRGLSAFHQVLLKALTEGRITDINLNELIK